MLSNVYRPKSVIPPAHESRPLGRFELSILGGQPLHAVDPILIGESMTESAKVLEILQVGPVIQDPNSIRITLGVLSFGIIIFVRFEIDPIIDLPRKEIALDLDVLR